MANYFRKRFSTFSTLTPFIRSTPVTSDLSKFRCFQGLVLILAKFRTTFRATKNVFLPRIELERANRGRGRSRLFLDSPEMKFKRDEKKFLISFSSATFDLRHECLETFFPVLRGTLFLPTPPSCPPTLKRDASLCLLPSIMNL